MTVSMYQRNEIEPEPSSGDLTEIHYYLKGAATSSDPRKLMRRKECGVLSVWTGANGGLDGMYIGSDKWSSTFGVGSAAQELAEPVGFYVRDLQFKIYNASTPSTAEAIPYSYTGDPAAVYPSRVQIVLTLYDPDAIVGDQTFAVNVSTMRND